MVDERNEKYEGEEGEYHFSDDQANYELEPETLKATKPPAGLVKESDGTSRYRRVAIAAAVFFVLMFVVYKMISPQNSTPTTDFSQATPAATPAVVKAPAQITDAVKAVQPPASTPTSAPAAISAPVVSAAPSQPSMQPQVVVTAPTPAPVQAPVQTVTAQAPISSQPAALPASIGQQQQIPQPPLAASTPTSSPVPADMPPLPQQALTTNSSQGAIPAAPLQNKDVMDRVTALEQQNAKLTNLLQIEYAQKISDHETQATATRAKLQELGTRVASMEAALNQITSLLQNTAGTVKPMPMAGPASMPPSKSMEPKLTYTVQAIIPGRAWLKSEAGDTVTVAEGDVLKDYGRITKIDPYDGVVEIDTGNKMVTLSYGLSGDA